VYEARAGQTFLLGASTWRIEEITRDRVLVSPAPGVPGAVPFWKGEGVGRPYELGEAIGAASRVLAALSDEKAIERLQTEHTLDGRAAQNLLTFLREQEAATTAVPSDRTVVVERFRDEIGDWRLCVLTPFGGRVHAPWALALGARLRESLGLETQAIWSDDGIAIHLPEADAPPPIDLVDVETASASPYAASLLFDYVANYMYEDDTPAAERRAQALSLDRDLLRELLGQEELRDLIDPGALAEIENQLRGEPRSPDEL